MRVVVAEDLQRHIDVTFGRVDAQNIARERAGYRSFGHALCGIQSEVDDAIAGCRDAPDARVGIVSRKYRNTFRRQRVNHACMFERDGFDRRHEFLMLALCVVHHRDRRLGDLREQRGFVRMVHAKFNHRQLMRGLQTEQRERQANIVVEVASSREACIRADRSGEDRRDHFLDRRLAIAPRHSDERHAEFAPPAARQCAERDTRIGHAQSRHVPVVGRARHQRCRDVA